jgi:hypothetical protein
MLLAKQYVKHPCPAPPVPWTVQATWFLAFVLFTAAIIGVVVTGFFAWSSQKILTALCVFWALVAALPLVFLVDVYGQGYLGGPDGPDECVGGRVASPSPCRWRESCLSRPRGSVMPPPLGFLPGSSLDGDRTVALIELAHGSSQPVGATASVAHQTFEPVTRVFAVESVAEGATPIGERATLADMAFCAFDM